MLAGAALVVVGGAAVAGGAAVVGAAAAGAGGGGLFLRSRHRQKKLLRKHEKMMALVRQDWEQLGRSVHTDGGKFRAWPRPVADLQTAVLPSKVSFELVWKNRATLAKRKVQSMLIDCNAEKELFLMVSAFAADGTLIEDFTAASLTTAAEKEHSDLPPVEVVQDDFGAPRQSLCIDFDLMPDEYHCLVVSCVFGIGSVENYDATVTMFEGRGCAEFDKVFSYKLDLEEGSAAMNAYVMGRISRIPSAEVENDAEWVFDGARRPLTYNQRFVDLPCRVREHGADPLPIFPASTLLQIEGADLYDNVHTTWYGFDRLGHLRCAVSTSDADYKGSNSKVDLATIFEDEHLCRVIVVAHQPEPEPFKYQVKVKVEAGDMLAPADQRHVMIMGNETWLKYRLTARPLTSQALFEVTRRQEFSIVPYPLNSQSWRAHLLGYAVQKESAFQDVAGLTGMSAATTLSLQVETVIELRVKESHGLTSTYVNVTFQEQKAKTTVDKNSGQPTWSETFAFNMNVGWVNDPIVYFELMSEKNVLIAETAFNLSLLPIPFSDYLPLYYGSEKKGRLRLKLDVTPDAVSAQPLAIAGSSVIENYQG